MPAPLNDRWAYKISAGGYTSDAFARPTGPIPNGTGTQYPNFTNQGTSQPKFDTRVDYDAEKYKLVFAGGYSGTDGIIHTGIGPFDSTGVGLGYGTMRYTRGRVQVQLLHQHPERRRQRPAGGRHRRPADPVRVRHADLRLRARQRQDARHAPSAQLRRQRAPQQLRPVDRAARQQPHGNRRLRPGRDLHERPLPPRTSAPASTSSTTSMTRCSRRAPR